IAAVFAGPALQTPMLPRLQFQVGFDTSPDARVIAYTAAVGVAAVLLFALVPALRATRPSLVGSLSSAVGGSARSARSKGIGMRATLVVAQVAISVVLLVGGALFVRSLMMARRTSLDFDPSDRVVLSVNPELQGYDQSRVFAFYRDVLPRVR